MDGDQITSTISKMKLARHCWIFDHSHVNSRFLWVDRSSRVEFERVTLSPQRKMIDPTLQYPHTPQPCHQIVTYPAVSTTFSVTDPLVDRKLPTTPPSTSQRALRDPSRYSCSQFCGWCQITCLFEEKGFYSKKRVIIWKMCEDFEECHAFRKVWVFLKELEAFRKRPLTFRKRGVITQQLSSLR